MEVAMRQVESSNVRAYGYDAASSTLVVVFKDSARYHYEKVPPELVQKLDQCADAGGSVGSFIHARMKGYYEGRKIDG
jgi:hypothetical protein